MGGLPVDVVQFIQWRFASRDYRSVLKLLDDQPSITPRVLRAALYLSNGSLSLLRWNLAECAGDVRQLLLAAEYAVGVGPQPLHVRSMAAPFPSEENLGPDYTRRRGATTLRPPLAAPSVPARAAAKRPSFHLSLAHRRFKLGAVTYVVTGNQPDRKTVRCYRIEGTVTALVRLPLYFVLEQLAEHVELEPMLFS